MSWLPDFWTRDPRIFCHPLQWPVPTIRTGSWQMSFGWLFFLMDSLSIHGRTLIGASLLKALKFHHLPGIFFSKWFYSPNCERSSVLRDHIIHGSLYTGFTVVEIDVVSLLSYALMLQMSLVTKMWLSCLPDFAVIWKQNQVTRQLLLRDLIHIPFSQSLSLSVEN